MVILNKFFLKQYLPALLLYNTVTAKDYTCICPACYNVTNGISNVKKSGRSCKDTSILQGSK